MGLIHPLDRRGSAAFPNRLISYIFEPPLTVLYWFGADLYYANTNHFVEEVQRLISESSVAVR